MTIRYDNALACVISAVKNAGGEAAIKSGDIAFLRDAAGVITAVILKNSSEIDRQKISEALAELGSYVDASYPVALPTELMDDDLANVESYKPTEIALDDGVLITALVKNRRMVGADWLSTVRDPVCADVPVVAFCSLKGGVGRSTALSIAARDLSHAGLRVLAIDLDLEAPGLGSMLLPEANRPEFGTLDYYVERGPSAFIDEDFALLIEASPYFEGGAPVYVAPAFGSRTFSNPENVLGKLSLAYLDEVGLDGEPLSFLERTRRLIRGLLNLRAFDVVLVDSRAGLHETSAATMLGIGADVLLFGTFQPQTFEGYLPLLSHMGKMLPDESALLPRLRMVHAKADVTNAKEIESFRGDTHRMFSTTLYDHPEQTVDDFESSDAAWFNVNDPDGPHFPWIIGESTTFRLFDPASQASQLDISIIGETFSDFVVNLRRNVTARLESTSEPA